MTSETLKSNYAEKHRSLCSKSNQTGRCRKWYYLILDLLICWAVINLKLVYKVECDKP